MKLKTLVEYQRCYDMMRAAESSNRTLTPTEYVDALKSSSMFDFELALHMNKMPEVEITDWSAA